MARTIQTARRTHYLKQTPRMSTGGKKPRIRPTAKQPRTTPAKPKRKTAVVKKEPLMSPVETPTRVQPKRKRAKVSYNDEISDDPDDFEEFDSDIDSDVEEAPKRKKLKAGKVAEPAKPVLEQKVFPFMSLPAELRNKVYAFALVNDTETLLFSKMRNQRRTVMIGDNDDTDAVRLRRKYGWTREFLFRSKPGTFKKAHFVPNLLAANQQIYAEAQPMLYSGNTFAFECSAALHTFCVVIGPRNCAALRNLKIMSWASKAMNHAVFAMLANTINLDHLVLDCKVAVWSDGKRIAGQFFRDASFWLETVGRAKQQKDAAVSVIRLGEQNCKGFKYKPTTPYYARTQCTIEMDVMMADFRAELKRLLGA